MDSGEFHCPNCNDNRVYNKKYVQDWFTLYFIPTFPVGGKKNEHIECEECSSIYHLDVIDYKPGLNDEEMTSEYEKALQNVLCLMIIADDLVIEFKNSGNYLIGSIIARIMYLDNDFYKCSSKEKVILSDLNNFFKKDADYIDHGIDKHEADKTGKSKGTWHTFQLKDGSGWIYLECMNWSDKFNSDGFVDELKITIFGTDFGNFLTNEAYK